jgi:tRNA uridine 5-carbamoylmethylation protein Kti12
MNLFDEARAVKPSIHILVGPPASGKSTWRARHLLSTGSKPFIFSSDDAIHALAASQGQTYDEAFRDVDFKSIERNLKAEFQDAIRDRRDIIIDRTNLSMKSRRKFLASIPKDYEKVAVVFNVGRELLDRRLADRKAATGMSVPKDVVDDMIKRYEEPTRGEGFDRIETV